MGKWAALAAVLTLAVFAVWRYEPFLTQEREVVAATATPDPIAGITPLTLAPANTACLDQVTFDPRGHFALFQVFNGPKKGPPLLLIQKAPGFSATTRVPGGYSPNPMNVRVPTPKQSTMGTFCFRNVGKGKQTIQLTGSIEGRLVSRPNTTVDGGPNAIKVALRFDDKPANLVSHIPRTFHDAATLKPIPVWFVWLLALLVILGLPAGVIYALGSTAGAAPLPGRAPAPPLPFRRVRRGVADGAAWSVARVRRIPLRWVGAGALAAVILYLAYWALKVRGFQNDENEYVYLARWTQGHFPQALWDFTIITRGLQRLEIWLLAVPMSLFPSPLAFDVARVLNVLAFVSAAGPGYLFARGLGLGRGWRIVAGVLFVVLPWAVVATTLLTEPLAYPAFAWGVWAIWRSAVLRTPTADLLALVLIGVAALARTNLALLAPLFIVTVLWQELRMGDWRDARGIGGRALAFGRGLVRGHAVLCGAVAAALLFGLLGRLGAVPTPRSLAGGYGLPFFPISDAFLQKTYGYLARLVAGIGFFPFVIGAPWIVARVVAPRRDAAAHALAVVMFVSFLFVLYVNSPAGTDERYIIYLAPALVIGFVAALARRDLAPAMVVAGGVAALWLLHHVGWNAQGGAFGFFVGPAESFYARIILTNLQQTFLQDPGPVLFVLQVIAIAVAAWIVTRRRAAVRATPWLVGFVLLVQVVQTQYVISHFVDQAMSADPPASGRAWIDKKIYGKGNAALYLSGAGNTTAYNPPWMEAEFWNNSLRSVVAPSPVQVQVPRDDTTYDVKVDPDTGVIQPQAHLPAYAVIPADGRAGLVGKTIASAGYIPAQLVQVDRPWRQAWSVGGLDPDGYSQGGGDVAIRVFKGGVPRGLANACLRVDAFPPFGFDGRMRVSAHGAKPGERPRSTPLEGKALARVEFPLERLRSGAGFEDLRVSTTGKPVKLADGRTTTMQLAGLAIAGC